ncbi:MAG: alpha-1,4-glucan--maltose-1-phosphate maltosyltransferase [Thermomicrobiales bacterium]
MAPRKPDGRRRAIIEGVSPEIDGGRYSIKRVVGESVTVEADIFTDGHDALSAVLLYRTSKEKQYRSVEMEPMINDRWSGTFQIEEMGRYHYTIWAWVDHFKTWARDLEKRVAAGQDISVDLLIGADLVEAAAARAPEENAGRLREAAEALKSADGNSVLRLLTSSLHSMMTVYGDRSNATKYDRELGVIADPVLARTGAWYELFPRSWSSESGKHGTFMDVIAKLPYVKDMGFDVLYLPPIHPIGMAHRKGKNNTVIAEPDDVGSPWAIGGAEGGHKAIHPDLGTLDDYKLLVETARGQGIEIAMDLAYQCSPDHPYVTEHPDWFRQRPDGTIQYAENPPKKYQDIYPFDFECADWKGLWDELKSIVDYWIEQGVRVFRVDNPHTKPFPFWEWLITDVKERHPETIFLSEAFTRPRVLENLAKLGFSQSYNYFAWRNTRWELTEYLTELTKTEVAEYLRPALWPNTPDILTEFLQFGGRPAFISRFVLAATLGATYGIYGPAFEHMDHAPLEAGREEYLHSEKYQIREWDLERSDSLRNIITIVNRARHENPALHSNDNLVFHPTDNEQLIAYSKRTASGDNIILTVVNLDPHYTQSGWIELPLEEWGFEPDQPYQVHDVIGQGRYIWDGSRNYVELNPQAMPAHVFRVRRRMQTEQDFDYFM